MTKLQELINKRKGLADSAAEIMKRHEGKETEPSAEELQQFDAKMDEVDNLNTQIEEERAREARRSRLESLERYTRESSSSAGGDDEEDDPLPHRDGNNTRNKKHRYSLMRAINLAVAGKEIDGLEGEVSQELGRRNKKTPKGFFVPNDLHVRRFNGISQRAALDLTTGAGAYPTVTPLNTWIDLLRNQTLMFQLGAFIFEDMIGKFSIPKRTAGSTAYWVTEGSDPTDSSPTIGQVEFQASTVAATSNYTRQFLNQSSLDAELFTRQDLAETMAIEVDRVGFAGSGAGEEPRGIINTTAVPQVVAGNPDGAALTWDDILQHEALLGTNNALRGAPAFVSTVQVRKSLKSIPKLSGSQYSDFIWDRMNEVNSYPAYATNQLPSNLTKGSGTNLSASVLGNFRDAVYAFWGGMDMLVDPFTAGGGKVKITAFQDVDFQLRYPESFSRCNDIVTT